MDKSTRNTLIAAAIFLAGFAALAYFLPAIMMAAAEISPYLAVLIAAVFLFAFFIVFWLRGRMKR